ncbi:MAG TPA: sporulation integral membrane protein YtvI [Bacilli bacterium]
MSGKTLILIALGLGFLYGLFTIGFPFLLAIVIAIFLEPFNVLLIKYARMNRMVASTIVCTVFSVLLSLVIYWLGLKIISEIINYLGKAPDYLTGVNDLIQEGLKKTQLFYETLPSDTAAQLQNGAETGMSALLNSLKDLASTLYQSLFNFAKTIPDLFIFYIVFIAALYMFSYSLDTLKGSFLNFFEEKSQAQVAEVLQNLRNSIFGFIRAQLIISMLTYIVTLVGLLILHVNFAMAIALLIVVVDILPILGTGSVLVPWSIYCFMTGDNFLGIGVIILYLFITVFRRMVEPKILGDAVGIGALPTLISLYIGFKLVGVVGLFLGPIVVIIYQAMQRVGLLNIKIKIE